MMDISSEIKARIVAAADKLYEEAGHEVFPAVDAVRREARVNMNDASRVMKEWRRAQTVKAAPVAIQVPAGVEEVSRRALVEIWTAAQSQANESLHAAQEAWEKERSELEALNVELSEAYDRQSTELESVRESREAIEKQEAVAQEHVKALIRERDEVRAALVEARERAAQVEPLRQELDDVRKAMTQAEVKRARLESDLAGAGEKIETLKQSVQALEQQAKTARDEGQVQATAWADREQALRDEVSQARQATAHRDGQLGALQQQNSLLLARLGREPNEPQE